MAYQHDMLSSWHNYELKKYDKRWELQNTNLGNREDDEEVEEETPLSLEVAKSTATARGVSVSGERRRAFSHLELEPHVPHVQCIGHAPEHRDGDHEPAVDEKAHTRVAYGQCVEEQRIHKKPRGAHQEEHPVPFLNPLGSWVQHHPGLPPETAAGKDVGFLGLVFDTDISVVEVEVIVFLVLFVITVLVFISGGVVHAWDTWVWNRVRGGHMREKVKNWGESFPWKRENLISIRDINNNWSRKVRKREK